MCIVYNYDYIDVAHLRMNIFCNSDQCCSYMFIFYMNLTYICCVLSVTFHSPCRALATPYCDCLYEEEECKPHHIGVGDCI